MLVGWLTSNSIICHLLLPCILFIHCHADCLSPTSTAPQILVSKFCSALTAPDNLCSAHTASDQSVSPLLLLCCSNCSPSQLLLSNCSPSQLLLSNLNCSPIHRVFGSPFGNPLDRSPTAMPPLVADQARAVRRS